MKVLVDPNVEPVRVGDIRWYPVAGQWLPSVTSILKATRVEGPELVAWKMRREDETAAAHHRRVEVEPARLRDEGADRGHVLHAMAESKLLRGENGAGSWWESMRPVLDRVTAVHGLELPVVHPLGFAGRCDLWCSFEDSRWSYDSVILDHKTARKPKQRRWCGEHVQQVAAYAAAVAHCHPDRVAPDHGVIAIYGEEHDLRCDACGWAATMPHDVDCPHCDFPTATIAVRGRKADRFVYGPRDMRKAFDLFAERVALFHSTHEPPDLPCHTQTQDSPSTNAST